MPPKPPKSNSSNSPVNASPRTTRSTATATVADISLHDVVRLIESSKAEILQSVREEFHHIKTHLHSLESRIIDIETSITNIQEKLNRNENDIVILKDTVSKLKNSTSRVSPAELLEEVEQRELRRNNIMIFGVNEKLDGSLPERKSHDQDMVNQVLQSINLSQVKFSETRRVGKILNAKCRPVRVTLMNRSEKRNILQNSRLLKNSNDLQKVYVSNDLTNLQQSDRQKLRDELKARKDAGDDVVIYRGEIRARDSIQNFQN